MVGFRSRLVVLLLCTLWVLADAAAVGPERGARSQRRGGGEKRRKLQRVHHGECSYTFILPELEGCQAGGPPSQPGLDGGSRSGVQRDSPPIDGGWSARKLQHLESKMENNTQWLQKVRAPPPPPPEAVLASGDFRDALVLHHMGQTCFPGPDNVPESTSDGAAAVNSPFRFS